MDTAGTPRRRATIADVARRAEADPALVSKVVNNDPRLRIKPETRQRILNAVAALDYRPSRTARNLRLSRSGTVGLIIPELTNPVWAAMAEAMEEQADEAGLSMLVATENPDGSRVRKMVSLLEERYLEGLLIAAPVTTAQASELAKANIVFVNQIHPAPVRSIAFDDALAVRLALDELIDLGHTRIAHIAGPQQRDAPRRRVEAFTTSLTDRGLNPGPVVAGELTADGGARMLDAILEAASDVTAIVIANVLTAAGALRRCAELGIAVPSELSLVCIHDNEMARVSSPSLSAVRMPIRELGRQAVRMLTHPDSSSAAPTPLILGDQISFVPRETTAPAAPSATR